MIDRPVLLQGAVHAETEGFVSALEGMERHEIAGYAYASGCIGGMPVVVARTGVGSIHAAASTALAIEAFKPALVLNQGLAGGHDRALHRGDIIVGEAVVPIGTYLTPWRGEGGGVDPFSWEAHVFTSSACPAAEDLDCLRGAPVLVDLVLNAVREHMPRAFKGVIGSGDVWNREADWITHLHRRYQTACEEMETFAAAKVSRRAKTPFLAMRILSNHELHGEEYDREIGGLLQSVILSILSRIFDYVVSER